jgi:hypothetical protein
MRFDVVHEGMRQPGFRTAMLSHMWLAMRLGRPRPENFLSETELRHIAAPVLMIWGDEDPYGGPEIGRRAAALIPNAHLEVIPARHAPRPPALRRVDQPTAPPSTSACSPSAKRQNNTQRDRIGARPSPPQSEHTTATSSSPPLKAHGAVVVGAGQPASIGSSTRPLRLDALHAGPAATRERRLHHA